MNWIPAETTTHQDHVIAHVIGATVTAYFILEETAFLLLDIGFIWNIFLDGEMGLLPHPVAIRELEAEAIIKADFEKDIDRSLADPHGAALQCLTRSPNLSPIQTVDFFVGENSRRLVLTCERGNIVVETSLETCEVIVNGNSAESEV